MSARATPDVCVKRGHFPDLSSNSTIRVRSLYVDLGIGEALCFNVAHRKAGLYVKRPRDAGLVPPIEVST